MKIKIKKTIEKEQEIEVPVPSFFKSITGSYSAFYGDRIVRVDSCSISIILADNYSFSAYMEMLLTEESCSIEDFVAALNIINNVINNVINKTLNEYNHTSLMFKIQ